MADDRLGLGLSVSGAGQAAGEISRVDLALTRMNLTLQRIAEAATRAGTGFDRLGQQSRRTRFDLDRTAAALSALQGPGLALTGVFGAAAGAVALLAKRGIDMNVTLNRATQTLTLLTGSSKEAARFIADLRKEALTSALEFKQMLPIANSLAASYGPEGLGKVIPTLRAFADSAVSLGVGKENIERALIQFKQMLAVNQIHAQDLRLIMENLPGVNLYGYLQDAFGTTDADALRKAKVTGRQVADAIVSGMQGQFGGAQQKLAGTLPVILSNFSDAFNEITGEITQRLTPRLEQALLSLLGKLQDLAKDKPALDALKQVFDRLGDGIETAADKTKGLIDYWSRLTPEERARKLDTLTKAFGAAGLTGGILLAASALGRLINLFKTLGGVTAYQSLVKLATTLGAAGSTAVAALAAALAAGLKTGVDYSKKASKTIQETGQTPMERGWVVAGPGALPPPVYSRKPKAPDDRGLESMPGYHGPLPAAAPILANLRPRKPTPTWDPDAEKKAKRYAEDRARQLERLTWETRDTAIEAMPTEDPEDRYAVALARAALERDRSLASLKTEYDKLKGDPRLRTFAAGVENRYQEQLRKAEAALAEARRERAEAVEKQQADVRARDLEAANTSFEVEQAAESRIREQMTDQLALRLRELELLNQGNSSQEHRIQLLQEQLALLQVAAQIAREPGEQLDAAARVREAMEALKEARRTFRGTGNLVVPEGRADRPTDPEASSALNALLSYQWAGVDRDGLKDVTGPAPDLPTDPEAAARALHLTPEQESRLAEPGQQEKRWRQSLLDTWQMTDWQRERMSYRDDLAQLRFGQTYRELTNPAQREDIDQDLKKLRPPLADLRDQVGEVAGAFTALKETFEGDGGILSTFGKLLQIGGSLAGVFGAKKVGGFMGSLGGIFGALGGLFGFDTTPQDVKARRWGYDFQTAFSQGQALAARNVRSSQGGAGGAPVSITLNQHIGTVSRTVDLESGTRRLIDLFRSELLTAPTR